MNDLMLDKKVVIIIPVRNSGEYLSKTINSILISTKYPLYRILIIESESTDGTAEYVDKLTENYHHISVIHTKKEGTTKAINTGIKNTNEDEDVLLTQDDVIFYSDFDWLIDMIRIAIQYENRDVGLITVKNGTGVSGESYDKGFMWIGTWCLYIPRKTIEQIGLFDENYNPGPGDDIDYSYRVYKAGLKTYVSNCEVIHHRKNDMNAHECEDEIVKKEHAKYFRKKWGLENDG